MQACNTALLYTLRIGRVSRNKDCGLLAHADGLHTYRLHQRLLGLSRRLCASGPDQQRIERIGSQEIRIEIHGLAGNGREIAYLDPSEAQVLAAYSIPEWSRMAIAAATGGR